MLVGQLRHYSPMMTYSSFELLNSNIECIYSEKSGQNIFQDMFCNTAIKINVPSTNSFFRQLAPDFNVEIDLIYELDQMWYSLDYGLTNTSFTINGTIDQAEWDKLESGLVSLQFYANDTMNNIGSGEIIIRKDINDPVIEIISPSSMDVFESLAPNFNIIITEAFLDTIWYTIDNGMTNFTCSTTGQIDQEEWSLLAEGTVKIQFYAKDTAGNIGLTEIYVMKLIPETTTTTEEETTDTTTTTTSTTTKEKTTTTTTTIPSISPWNLFEISSIFTLVIALLISKRQRKK
ncbi:hypothetical protein CEE45_13245 [Candidatus Heimdallarchaeota archaeon B3_Heim]|nr:MAG: hypothetical protein CEE45_13245 [Candidatus Heimdallarchaeota archaeon B3_Heim]